MNVRLEEWVAEQVVKTLKEQRVAVKNPQELEDYAVNVATTLFCKVFEENFDAEVFRQALRKGIKDLST